MQPATQNQCCPTCGKPVEAAASDLPQFVAATCEISFRGKCVRVRPLVLDLFELLLESYPKPVSVYELHAELYSERSDDELPEMSIIPVLVCHLRRAFKGGDLPIEVVARGGHGARNAYALVLS